MSQYQELLQNQPALEWSDDQQHQHLCHSVFETVNRLIFKHFGLNESVDADSCSVWMLELLKALEDKKVAYFLCLILQSNVVCCASPITRFQLILRHGKGVCEWPNGDKYEGDFRFDVMWGWGRMRQSSSSDVFEGEFKGHVRVGEGVLSNHDGSMHSGHWYASLPHGLGVQMASDGKFSRHFSLVFTLKSLFIHY